MPDMVAFAVVLKHLEDQAKAWERDMYAALRENDNLKAHCAAGKAAVLMETYRFFEALQKGQR